MFDIRNIDCSSTHLKIRIGALLKQSKPNRHLSELFISEYILDRDLCVVRTYLHYLGRTEKLRQDTRLFVTTQKPYSWVSKATLSHWICNQVLIYHVLVHTALGQPHVVQKVL